MDFSRLLQPVPRRAVFKLDDYVVWCGTMARHDDGRYYLIYSRWPKKSGHQAWVTQSEVAVAVAEDALGPYRHERVILAGAGGRAWDRDCVHNPTLLRVGKKYALYYMGNFGNGEFWDHRNHQRVGVALADHPAGPWKRFDRPVIDVTPGRFDGLMTSNPTAALRPDGKIVLMYKAVAEGPLPKGGAVICGMATADEPTGPFVKFDEPVMVNPENPWSVEDPFLWWQGDRFWALAKDFQGYFTKRGPGSVGLFDSTDGLRWKTADHPFAFETELVWEDGVRERLLNLERPQIYLEDGKPKVLFCAAANEATKTHTFNVHIPLGA
ncbi:MAG: glycoside hydrolase family protein [Spirochaetes bacterium]|nr:glycoside hydrolase family protein [Spirochaetota bacterium]